MASLYDFCRLCQSLSQTQSRIQMATATGEFLATLDPAEAEIAARFLIGRPLAPGAPKRLQISGRAVWRIAAHLAGAEDQGEDIFAAAEDFGEAVEMVLRLRPVEPEPSLTLIEVQKSFDTISSTEGRGSRARKLEALGKIFERASSLEGKYLAKVLISEMRHGLSEGILLEAIAKMAGRSADEIRRAHMLEGDVGRLVHSLRPGASETLREPAVMASPTRPLRPMLAHPVANIEEAFAVIGPELALEHKLDGARVQVHTRPGEVRIFSRRLNEISDSLPEVVDQMGRLGVRNAIFDGEVIAVAPDGRPLAFQEVMRRFGRIRDVKRLRVEQPIRLFLFDLLALDGQLLIDRPYRERRDLLAEASAGAGLKLVRRIVPRTTAEAVEFFSSAISDGYEGVLAKSLEARYTPGVRGRGWLKIKRVNTLDLVIVAAEWGYGRRHGWLSNYHLAARDDRGGGFAPVGKTFKGLSDDQFREMTERLTGLKVAESRGIVTVRPEVVVEVAYNDIQRSSRYAGGMVLRFARIVAIREDKTADQADTLQSIARRFGAQSLRPRTSPH